MVRGGATYYYYADNLGSVTSLMDSTGAIVASYVYDSFGNVTASTGTVENPYRYTAREWDEEIGLYYYRARYYDPEVGRFLSEDPLRFSEGENFFTYVGNSAVNFTDPLGLRAYKCMRPIRDVPGSGQRNGPDSEYNPVFHQFLCVERNGRVVCAGQRPDPGHRALIKRGDDSRESFVPGSCNSLLSNSCVDSCLLKEFNSPRPKYNLFSFFGSNCKAWSNDTHKRCKTFCDDIFFTTRTVPWLH